MTPTACPLVLAYRECRCAWQGLYSFPSLHVLCMPKRLPGPACLPNARGNAQVYRKRANILNRLFVILANNCVHPATYLIKPCLSQACLWIGVL